jgi:DNA-binding transcriptional MerR regulator
MKPSEFKVNVVPFDKRIEAVRANPEDFGLNNIKTLEPMFTRGDVGIDLRKIYHWEKEGLLPIKNENREWRKYSFIEYVWLKIIEQLREYKIGLEILQKVRDSLFYFDEKGISDAIERFTTDPQYSSLQSIVQANQLKNANKKELMDLFRDSGFCNLWSLVGAAIHLQSECTLLLNSKGYIGFFVWNEYNRSEKLKVFFELLTENSVTIQISLSNIVKGFLNNDKIDIDQYYTLELLTENEKQVIDIIRDRRYTEINIFPKNGEIERVTTKERKAVKQLEHRVFGMMKKGDYKKIEINVEDGNIVTFTEIGSIKFKKAKK